MTTEDLAYAAGVIDGEGYIGITTQEPRPLHHQQSPSFRAVVNVCMADREVVAWLHEIFGGGLYSYPPRTGARAKRGVHHWRITGDAAAEFCLAILPYLRLKCLQAKIIIRYREDAALDHTRRGGQGVRTPPAEIEIKRAYAAEIRALNQREATAA